MTLLDSSWLKFWEVVGTTGILSVIAGVVGEGLADFEKWPKDAKRRKKMEKFAWRLLLVGLVLEFWGNSKVTGIKDLEIARLSLSVENARKEAADARLEQERIKEKLAWRLLSRDQARRI